MKGSYQVRVSRRRGTSFRFEVKRNITVVRGDSGTGKTTLYDMIADHMRLGDRSGVTVQCDRPCIALTDMDWHNQLSGVSDSTFLSTRGLRMSSRTISLGRCAIPLTTTLFFVVWTWSAYLLA